MRTYNTKLVNAGTPPHYTTSCRKTYLIVGYRALLRPGLLHSNIPVHNRDAKPASLRATTRTRMMPKVNASRQHDSANFDRALCSGLGRIALWIILHFQCAVMTRCACAREAWWQNLWQNFLMP